MRRVVKRGPLNWLLQWTPMVLFAGAFLILAYCGFVVIDSWMFQRAEQRHLAQLLDGQREVNSMARRSTSPTPAVIPAAAVDGALIGRIEIRRLGLSTIVMEGTSRSTLRRAVGHISGTGLPGQPGNVGLSAHRDGFFRPLKDIRENDIITLATLQGEYNYRVVSTRVVAPEDVAVLDPGEGEILTLVTCHPFYLVGSAPNRFIVRAERVTG